MAWRVESPLTTNVYYASCRARGSTILIHSSQILWGGMQVVCKNKNFSVACCMPLGCAGKNSTENIARVFEKIRG